jgi:hypothetical protein
VEVKNLVAVREATATAQQALHEAEVAMEAQRSKAERLNTDLEAKAELALKDAEAAAKARWLEAAQLDADIEAKRALLVETDDRRLLQEFGLFEPKYRLASSSDYKVRLDATRTRQKEMVRGGSAFLESKGWSINGSEAEGRRMVRDYSKLIVRAFNTECDATVEAVRFFNLEASRTRIRKSFDMLNKLGARMSVGLSEIYLDAKHEELDLAFEFQVKKQEEKEEQKRLREQAREDAKLQREIDAARETLAKEERHYRRALVSMEARLAGTASEADRTLLEAEVATIRERIAEVDAKRAEVDYRAQNASAGYVYVISNIGAFGEGVFKIGVTRRLEPLDRIDELGDASVPFDFDVHTLVFSDNAYGLELALHRHFAASRLNMVNGRKEFFRATIEEIEAVLRGSFGKPVEVTKLADAAAYRQSLRLGAPHAPEPSKHEEASGRPAAEAAA